MNLCVHSSSACGARPIGGRSRQRCSFPALRPTCAVYTATSVCRSPFATSASANRPPIRPVRKPGICRSSKNGNEPISSGNGDIEASKSSHSAPTGKAEGPPCNDEHQQRYSTGTGSGSETSDEEPMHGTAGANGRTSKQACNKYQDEAPSDEKLRSLMCWDVDGQLPKHHTSRRGLLNQVQLSTYANSIGNNLTDLMDFLENNIKDAIGSLHLLPIYPSTGDRGFGPVNYKDVDPELGTWGDVQKLAERYQLCLEFMVNHISPASAEFKDYIANGDQSPYAEMFVRWKDIWGSESGPTSDQLQKIRTRKPAPPVIEIKLKSGKEVPIWCTFGDQQIDINPFTEHGWSFIVESLQNLCEKGQIKMIRLDAFGYVTKKAGTSCFMQEPGVWELLDRIKGVVKPYGVQLLCEVHEDFNLNIELARHGYWVYDFALPLLMLHALQFKTADPLKHWLSICPRRQITTLDTHDGMGVDDIAGLAPLCAVPEMEKAILRNGGNINYKHLYEPSGAFELCGDPEQEGCEPEKLDCQRTNESLQKMAKYLQPDCLQGCYKSVPHQYNETYFSAVGENPQSYLLARAVQFFTPGIPMVYYVGLLAGRDDFELMEQGSIRDINRHYYTLEEAQQATQRPVVQALLQLCRFRNSHPAFRGRVYIDDSTPKHQLHVRWYSGTQHLAVLRVDFQTQEFTITHTPYEQETLPDHIAALDASTSADRSPYSLELDSFSSIDAMDTDARISYRHQMAELALADADAPDDGSSGGVTNVVINGSGANGGTNDKGAKGVSSLEDSGASEAVEPPADPPIKQHLGQGLSLEAVASIDGKLGEGDCLLPARKSARSEIPDELNGLWCDGDTFSDQVPQASGTSSDNTSSAGVAGQAAAAEGPEQDVSATGSSPEDSGASSSDSEAETGHNEAVSARASRSNGGGGGRARLQMQQLDMSWAWKLPDEPVCAPTSQRVAATAS